MNEPLIRSYPDHIINCERSPAWRRIATKHWDNETNTLVIELSPAHTGFSPLQAAMWVYLNNVWADAYTAADAMRKNNPKHPLIAVVDLLAAEVPVTLPPTFLQYARPTGKKDMWRVIVIAPDGSWSTCDSHIDSELLCTYTDGAKLYSCEQCDMIKVHEESKQ